MILLLFLFSQTTDDVLIDNQAVNEACQQFDKAIHLPSGSSSRDQNISSPAEMNISAPAEVKNTCAPVETDGTSSPGVEPVSPKNKQELKPKKKRRKKGSFFTKKQRKEASKTPAAKEKTEGTPLAAKNKTGSTPSAATGLGTMIACSAGKKRKTGKEHADVKKREPAATKKQETGKTLPATKKQKIENTSSATKKQETENAPFAIKKETESSSLNLKIEKAVLVAVNSRRSQRVRKPKVFC